MLPNEKSLNSEIAMAGTKTVVVAKRILWALGLLLVVSGFVNAERLPIKTYTTADGLTSNKISRIVRDSHNFLWFCTEDGLSRFDGYTFTSYTTHQGLPSNWIDGFLETRSGVFFVATNAGLCVFDPRGIPLPQEKLAAASGVQPMFAAYRPGTDEGAARIKVLYEDNRGQIWCGTRRGLYHVEVVNRQVTFHYVDLGIQSSDIDYYQIRSIVEEASGVLWIATEHELYRRFLDGKIERVKLRTGLPNANLMSLVQESERQFWLATRSGLWSISQLSSADFAENSFEVKRYAIKEGLPCVEVNALFRDSEGKLWVATDCGLYEFLRDEKRFRLRLDNRYLQAVRVWSLNEDASGNLWAGTAHGAIKIERNGFTTFTEADGIGFRDISQITETSAGEIRLYTRYGKQNLFIDKFDGERFISQKVKPSAFAQTSFDWFDKQFPVQDRVGEWWWPTQNGLFRFARASRVEELFNERPIAHYTMKDGLPGNYVHDIYEDRQGDIWISIELTSTTGVVRWERATGKFYAYSKSDGLSAVESFWSICEDRQGNLWIGSGNGGIARYQDRRFTTFTAAEGVPEGKIRQLLFDSQGRIWIASEIGGLGRIDDPAAERPQIVKYTTAEGLASNSILYVAEDRLNRYFVATTRGLNYIDFDRDSFKRFTISDGLANDQVDTILRDSGGAFWFGTATGVSRLVPQPEINQASPSIFINGIKVAGQVQRISAVGETDVQQLELTTNQNQIEIAFGGLSFAAGDLTRYQYKLEGADSDWQFTVQRTINFANLQPGAYRFLVRAINADGVRSETPASFSFTILLPIWRRWWFVMLAALALALAVYGGYRYRVARLLELERVRTRIATDLHDDIGSSLSQIAIMSEVVRRQVGGENQRVSRPLSVIAGTSRELVDSMADIVWAINPKRDHLIDLTQRMRQFAGDVLAARNIEFTFAAPGLESDIRIETDVRREVFLIFKEAINNAVRHSECSSVEIKFGVNDTRLMLKVADDGRSFDPARTSSGHGLASMKRRAESIGGTLDILAGAGRSTTITLQAPLRRRRLRRTNIST